MPDAITPGAITVVLPTFDRLPALRANLADVLDLVDVEQVVVVDDGSTDSTAAWLAGITDPRLRVERHPRNLGSPAARNTGVAAAATEWVLFAEDDCRFPRDYAQVLRKTAEQFGADVVGAPMVWPAPGEEVEDAVARARSTRTGDGGLDDLAGFPPEPLPTPLVPAPSLVRRSVAAALRFDPGYGGNAYREETDFFLRAERAGHRCLLTGDTYFWEPRRYAGGQPRTLAAEWWTWRNNWRFLRRHGEWLAARGLVTSPLREQAAFTVRRLRRR